MEFDKNVFITSMRTMSKEKLKELVERLEDHYINVKKVHAGYKQPKMTNPYKGKHIKYTK